MQLEILEDVGKRWIHLSILVYVAFKITAQKICYNLSNVMDSYWPKGSQIGTIHWVKSFNLKLQYMQAVFLHIWTHFLYKTGSRPLVFDSWVFSGPSSFVFFLTFLAFLLRSISIQAWPSGKEHCVNPFLTPRRCFLLAVTHCFILGCICKCLYECSGQKNPKGFFVQGTAILKMWPLSSGKYLLYLVLNSTMVQGNNELKPFQKSTQWFFHFH